ncbi:Aminotran-1-2 domain-containing protein [Fusarium falciforme]|uniref:Aminotran-1-2 domain-containing protein n=1 Tax=Fusarium falciforme TaxID=195108 RepID=UPI002300F92C|nr:Aminotran-1-2 domain-containing protein [Fusarium falciforme]WAO84814.1 Aminotran-1-2 domain-containing protein [Fusarium falciforme]
MPGLTSAVDAITYNARVVGVTYHDIGGYNGLDDVFRPDMNRKALQSAFEKATQEGTNIRALMISNPHNPLGRCYVCNLSIF